MAKLNKSSPFGRLLWIWLVISPNAVWASEPLLRPIEPEPFRRDDGELSGRDFEYNEQSFLTRFTYRHPAAWDGIWEQDPGGFRITAGSVRSDELYVVYQLEKELAFDRTFFGVLNFRRDEDYDSTYDVNLAGLGAHLGAGWSVRALADFVSSKEDIDLQFELRKDFGDLGFIRAAFVSVDHFFNSKSDTGEYSQRPFTYFLHGLLTPSEQTRLQGWVNLNPKLRLEYEEDAAEFGYEQVSGGARVEQEFANSLQGFFSAYHESGTRDYTGPEDFSDLRDFERDAYVVDAIVRRPMEPHLGWWIGARYYYFDEEDFQPNDRDGDRTQRRREHVLHAGIELLVAEKWTVSPGLYLDFIDYHQAVLQEPDLSEESEELIVRLTLPIEYSFSERAMVMAQPTLEFPDGPFGGLNVQVQVLF